MRPLASPAFPIQSHYVAVLLWFLMAVSSVVNIEPAPFDLLAFALCIFFATLGLRVPQGLYLPFTLLMFVVLGHVLSIVFGPAVFGSQTPYMVFYSSQTLYLVVLWLVLASLICTGPEPVLRALWGGWLVAAVLAVTLGLAAYFHLIPGWDKFMMMGRAQAAFKDPNVYGPFLIPPALYLLSRMQSGRASGNLFRTGVFLYFVVGLLIGFSRGAWGNFGAAFLVLTVLLLIRAQSLHDYVKIFLAGTALVAITAVVLTAAISSPKIGEMFKIRASLLQKYDTEAGGRFSTQLAAVTVVADYPLGLGPNRTKPFLDRNPHNVYLKVLTENGWVGGIAFIVFVGLTVWRGFWFAIRPGPLQRDFAVAYACTLGIVAESIIIDTLHWRHYYVLLAMIWGMMLSPASTTTNSARQR